MDFNEKISLVLKHNKLGIATREDLSEYCGFHKDTIRKAIERESELKDKNLRIFQDKLGINTDWWDTGKGPIFNEKPTSVDKTSDNDEKKTPEEIYRDLIESNSEYRLVHKTILTEEYRIVLKTDIDEKTKILWEVIASKNYAIAQLEKEIAELRAGKIVLHAQNA